MSLITVRQARKILKKNSNGAVYDLVRAGGIPPGPLVRLGGRIYFNEDQLREFIEKGGTAANKNSEARESSEVLQTTA